ncbi:MAG TPA: AAA family ATPase, partial [Candidatus Limnocylindria bacterium]|nr:AAA family ATPase [Candidatus Limnocylindria bacterium]
MPPRSAGRTAARKPEKPERTVTRAFLFSDLRGYTDFVESRGDVEAAALLREYRGIVRAAVARGGGAEVKTEGDSFYVVFESALAALECAVAIHRGAQAYNDAHPSAPIRIGMGLHVGETVPYDDQFVGGAVNVAARLASKAKAGELVVSDTFRGLVRTGQRYPMEDLGPQRLKGVTERLRAWMVDWREPGAAPAAPPRAAPALPLLSRSEPVVPRPVPGQLVCPVVVGRTAERARFAEHLTLAREGRGQTVLLSGEAGVGKSAFTRQSIETASAEGFRVLYGVTVESDGGLPYAPFVAAVRSGFRGIERERLGRVLAQTAPDLAQLFPELSKSSRSEPATTVEQHRLSVAFQGLFSAFAREAPVLLVVEDLHWCDEASLSLLHYLARELRDTRVLLLGTYRSDEMHRRHPLLRVLAGMQRERLIGEIALGKLTPAEVRELIRATLLPTDPNISVSEEFSNALYARSEGNPFFTEELIKSLVESGDIFHRGETGWDRKPIDQMKIPGSVREAVRARVEKLSPDAQATLSAAAAIGLRFSFDLLRSVRGIPEAELEAQLREFVEQQLVIELGGRSDEYGFRHALTKEVVYDDLMVRERKRLHRAVADALAADTRSEPALIAHHLIVAADHDAALPFLLEAARRAYRAFAPRDAAAHYEKAIEIGVPAEQLGPTLEALAETYYLFDFARSRKASEEAAALYREQGDVRGASRMLRLASRNVWQQGEPERPSELAQEAIDVLDGLEETVELGRAIANLAGLRMVARADTEAVALAER